jgi:GT2 family glycosyltransferase
MTELTTKTDLTLPVIGFIVATLNEATTIERCIESILNQDYPADLIRVAVIDGGSADDTVRIVSNIARDDSRVRLFDNPKRIAASAFNIGIRESEGDIVSLVSAHSTLSKDYARILAEAFAETDALLVGGRIQTEAITRTPTADGIARAVSSPYGVGNAKFHFSDKPGWVDTAFPGAYRRHLLDEIGYFDEDLIRNQDDELHYRARAAGYGMWYDPRLLSSYFPRTSYRALATQYYQYGYWRAATVLKHRRIASPRHLVPGAFIGMAIVGLLMSPRSRLVKKTTVMMNVAYGCFIGLGATREIRRGASSQVATATGTALAILHISYGAGFWVGMVSRDRWRARGRST